MSRKSTILQKCLSEVDAELGEAFRLPPHSDSGHKIVRRLQKKFVYITNLLTAEAASTPEKNDGQLDEVRDKLAGLESAFHCLSEYRTYALQSLLEDAPTSLCTNCMQKNLDDADTDADDDADEPESPRMAPEHSDGGEKRDSGGGFGKVCGAFGSGAIVGAVVCCIAINFSSLLLDYPDIYFIPPT